jgi:DNA-binding LacI/PurR family transcriptional regulator
MNVPKAVRMKDVAARCGVAESTVSHVLNHTKFVAPDTRARIEQALREMNFHRDSHARRLARGHSNFLGLIISDIENPYYPGVIKGFESAAVEQGYEILLCTTNYDPARTEQAFRKMIENKSPGVAVLTSNADPAMQQYLASHGVASVFLESGGATQMKADIRLDFQQGAGAAVNYLHRLGHRGFALIAGPQHRASHRSYRLTVESVLRPHQLDLRVVEGGNDVAGGERAVQVLLAEARFPTAILCSNDLTAMGAMRALKQAGMRVPEDVSVVGADDIPFASLTQPPLTTVRMPRERLGRLAMEMLGEVMNEAAGEGRDAVLETELVIRESTGSAPQG